MVGKSYYQKDECNAKAETPSTVMCGSTLNTVPTIDPRYQRLYERRECLQMALQAQTPVPLELAKQFHEWLYGE